MWGTRFRLVVRGPHLRVEMWGTRFVGWGELIEADAVGDDVDLLGGGAHLDEGSASYGGGNCDRVGLGVDGLLAREDVWLRQREREFPAGVLGVDDLILEALMG